MYLINENDFQSDYFIPNTQELRESALTVLEQFVDNYARLLLKNALGYSNFNDLDSNVTNGVLDSGAPQKWLDLVNGVEYEKDGITYSWQGLVFEEGTKRQSLLVPYVYYYWLLNEQQKQSGVGTVVVNTKNATNVNATQTLVNAWNDFVTLYQYDCEDYYRYFYNISIDFPYWWSNDSTNYVSLVKFLRDNEDNYPDAPLNRYEYKNSFGL